METFLAVDNMLFSLLLHIFLPRWMLNGLNFSLVSFKSKLVYILAQFQNAKLLTS